MKIFFDFRMAHVSILKYNTLEVDKMFKILSLFLPNPDANLHTNNDLLVTNVSLHSILGFNS